MVHEETDNLRMRFIPRKPPASAADRSGGAAHI